MVLISETCFSPSAVRNKDMSWPEEMSFIANSSKMDRHKGELEDADKRLLIFIIKLETRNGRVSMR